MPQRNDGRPPGRPVDKRRARRELARRVKAAAMTAVLVLSQALGFATAVPSAAAAASFDSVTLTNVTNIEDWPDIDAPYRNFHAFEVSGSSVSERFAFCGDKTMATPSAGTVFTNGHTLGNAQVDYILYHGYSSTNTQGYGCTPGKFYTATQYALWLALPDSNGSHAEVYSELSRTYQAVEDATYQLLAEANAYASNGGGGVEAGTGVYWPSPDGVAQGLLTRTNPVGGISLQKSSDNTAITSNNPSYSLAGALYGIYSDPSCTTEVGRLSTDASGRSDYWGLQMGTYYVKEISAPSGYLADENTYEVNVEGGTWTRLNVTETPAGDPLGFIVQKVDSEGNESAGFDAQGGATTAGTQFTIKYYTGFYDSTDNLPEAATRTWVIETKQVGNYVVAYLTDDYKVSGDAFYVADGQVTIPLGTFTVQETKAPEGYTISDASVHIGQVVEDESTLHGASIVKIGNWTTKFNQIENGAGLAVEDQVIHGGVSIQKIDHDLNVGVSQGDATLAGAVISVINANENSVVVDGVRYAPGEEVTTIVTDASGAGSTAADALPYGNYTLKEKTPPSGYQLNTDWEVTVSIQQNNVVVAAPSALPDEVTRGGGSVVKVDADLSQAVAQGDATLAGGEISIINRSETAVMVDGVLYQPGDVVSTITTGANGSATTSSALLPYGTYEAYEAKAPEGYNLNSSWSQTFEIRTDGQVVTIGNLPDTVERGGVTVRKVDLDWGTSEEQGDATLEGAEFTIYNRSTAAVMVDGTMYQPGDPVKVITTDESGIAATAEDSLPYGTYEVKETKAPEGYNLNSEWSKTFEIRSEGQMLDFTSDVDVVADDVIRGGVSLRKVDAELLAAGSADASKPLGGGTLEGAVFEITNVSAQAVVVGGATYEPGEVVLTLRTDENGAVSTAADALPYGTYEIREVASPNGYLLNEDWSKTVQVREDGVVYDLTSDDDAVADQAIRGDLELQKHDEDSQERMSGIPFKITSKTTGEWHIAVTDENGMLDTSAEWNSHESRANASDEALLADGTVDETKLDAYAGIWFSGRTDEQTSPDDRLGALPYDVYDIEELRCSANEGHRLVSTTVTVSRNSVKLDLGTFDDKEIAIATTLVYGNGSSRSVPVGSEVELTDQVRFEELERGHEYQLVSELHAFDDEGNDTGVVASSQTVFSPKLSTDTQDVTFTLDTTELDGMTLVAYEKLYDGNDLVASHEDPKDADQTVYVPSIGTVLISDVTSDHDGPSYADSKVTDTAALENLVVGEEYTVTGELHLRGEDGTDAGAVTDDDGDALTATTTFEATAADMSVQLTFDVATSELAGKTIVAFETLSNSQGNLVSHNDITDEGQSVRLPSVATEAISEITGDHQASQGVQAVTDTVSLENLLIGREYTVNGTLHLKNEDGTDGGVLTDAEGKPVSATTTFTADAEDMEVELTFNLDATDLGNRDVVAFEELTRDTILLATHADINDADQTVHVPEVGTTATSDTTGDHNVPANDGEIIVDKVQADNLIVGKEYTVTGELHVKGVDADGNATDEGVLTDAEGNPVTAETTFVAESEQEIVCLRFEVDASLLQGKTMVAFETLSSEDVTLVVHADINDEDQTTYVPSVGTSAASEATGEGDLPAFDGQKLVDTVDLTNLIAGHSYTLRGTVHLRTVDESGRLVDGGEIASAGTTFTAESATQTVELTFDLNGRELSGSDVTCFEELWRNEVKLAEHSDITDEGQTVQVPDVRTTAISEATGDHEAPKAAETVVTDTVELENLLVGKAYVVTGSLHLVGSDDSGNATDEGVLTDAEGSEVTATTSFVAESESQTVELSFTIDSERVAGHDVVAFEDLSSNGVLLATHADINDADQTVHVPEVGTTATSEATGDHDAPAYPDQVVTDVVHAENLTVGNEYTVTGELHVKGVDADGNATDEGVLTDAEGNPVTAETTFVAESETMDVELSFAVDGDVLEGKTLVAFETLSRGEVELVVHADINDEDQTVRVPEVGTTATSVATGDHDVPAFEGQVVTDEVQLNNLLVGTEYTLRGSLRLVEAGEGGAVIDAGPVTDAAGREATAETTFTADAENMTVELSFTVDGDELAGKSTVAYEQLWHGDVMVADHSDPADEGQTVRVPDVNTTATDGMDGDHEIGAYEDQVVVDSVELSNLIVGKEYTVTGELHVKGVDADGNATDEGVLTDAEGNPVTAETTFVAESENQAVELVFEFDASLLAGKDVVAFEDLSSNGVLLATHADINDADQTVHVPKVETTFVSDGGGHEVQLEPSEEGSHEVTLVDTVAYENLTAGEEYVIYGTIHLRGYDEDGNATDEGALTGEDGTQLTAEATFTPAEPTGEVEVMFTFDASKLAGQTLVAYEQLWNGRSLVASHEDITDEGQTVSFVDIATTATDAADGDHDVLAAPRAEVVDTVEYEGLTPGVTYELVGELHLRDNDGSDAGVLTNPDGEPIMASAQLTPEAASGTAEVRFSFDATGLEGMSAVAFEELRRDGVTIATHADIADEGQTVTFVVPPEEYPNMGQNAGAVAAIGAGTAGLAGLAGYLGRRRRRNAMK